jgi:lysophospholipid acyltransferase (LPLAT)-like uncharacterized protein
VKIRNRTLIKVAGWMAARMVRLLVRTLRFECLELGEPLTPPAILPGNTDRHIYAIWHENLLLPTARFGDDSLAVLISKHADGQILGSLIEHMGMSMVQGSTNRGGIEAVRKLIDPAQSRRHLAVTPDGPRGPRQVVQPGIVYVASRTGMKIVCVGIGYCKAWRMKSWDRFAIPKPFSRAVLLTSRAIAVPAGLKSQDLDAVRQQVQAAMEEIQHQAEHYAHTRTRSLHAALKHAA